MEFELQEPPNPRANPLRTHCKRGHALTDDNVYEYTNGKGRRPSRRCRQCTKDAARRWQEANPERYRELSNAAERARRFRDPDADRRAWLLRRYGLTEARFAEILAAQDGRCPICSVELTREMQLDARGHKTHRRNSAVVDHCHATGVVRGILCIICNKGLGAFGDDAATLRRATAYLEAPR